MKREIELLVATNNDFTAMSAQYRPYRDEEGLEGDNINWSDQEPGTVQIYEKTRDETCSVSTRTLVIGGIGIGLLGALLGLLIGYFAHYEHSSCVPSLAVALNSVRDEDVTIRSKIMNLVDSERIKENIRTFSSHPHIAGSTSDYDLAEVVKNKFRDNGLDKIVTYDYKTLLSYPNCENPNKIAVVDSDEKDLHIIQKKECEEGIAPYNAYAPQGKILGDLVFVNYGKHSDFSYLNDIDLKGKILIAKHYFPAKQAWDAYHNGAAGLILYPDPYDYNPSIINAKPYPNSWWLPGDAVIRESVLWNGIGDPQTTDYPAIKKVHRLPSDSILPRIPVQPISYNEAYTLLRLLGGNAAPESWQGGFNFTLRIGPGLVNSTWKTSLEVNNKIMNKTVRNVLGYIKGKVESDRYVLIGSHRDAWVHGAVDSASGTAALLELSYVFGHLLKKGWRPRRTIIFCNWGAEEFNLMGSTEWLEENFKILHGRAVAYINIDAIVIGNTSLNVAASPLLYHAIFNATKEVCNPNDEEVINGVMRVYDSWKLSFPLHRNISRLIFPEQVTGDESFLDYEFFLDPEPEIPSKLLDNFLKSAMLKIRPRIRSLDGRGSYSTFTRAGIPAVDMAFIHDTRPAHATYPLYHTEYDVFDAIEKFVDPKFKYYSTIVKILGELLRDLADSLFLPFNLFDYAQVLHDFYLNLQNEDKIKHQVDFSLLNSSVSNFTTAALKFHTMQESSDLSDPMVIRRINDQLLLLERAFLDPNGFSRYVLKRHLFPSHGNNAYDETFPAVMDYFTDLLRQKESISQEDFRILYSFLVLTIQSATAIIEEVV